MTLLRFLTGNFYGLGLNMASKIKISQPQILNQPQGRDSFQTPNYAVDLLIPYIPKYVRWVWEPASGNGKISNRLSQEGLVIYSSDILPPSASRAGINFLTELPSEQPQCIITNPPFSLKEKFYKRCLEYGVPFALLIPADYSGWIIEAIQNGAEKIIPTRRIDYITPTGLSGASGHTSNFHSMWLTHGFNLGKTETFVELSLKDKENI
jgi:hypothetical protein